MKTMPQDYYEKLEEIQTVDFVLIELTLYLDTHPDDTQALQQFNTCYQQSKMLKQHFEAQYGPLQQYGNSYTGYPWNWSDQPWPWEV